MLNVKFILISCVFFLYWCEKKSVLYFAIASGREQITALFSASMHSHFLAAEGTEDTWSLREVLEKASS